MKTISKYPKLIAALVAILIGNSSPAFASETNQISVATFDEIANAKNVVWEFLVNWETLKKQPSWDGHSTEPPLPMHQAVTTAMQAIEKANPQIVNWRIDSITARPISFPSDSPFSKTVQNSHSWLYQIQLAPKDEATYDKIFNEGRTATLCRVVLMDGTLVGPSLKVEKE
ncbi:MAG TPA: hypothetical protein VH413_18270 [Verrucomicrobiae bacterium]|nr:hypothetical protein [Verrucomicrobiae bacterium]